MGVTARDYYVSVYTKDTHLVTTTERSDRIEQLLEALVEQFDTSGFPYTYEGDGGGEVEVTPDTGEVLDEALRLLYTDVGDGYEIRGGVYEEET